MTTEQFKDQEKKLKAGNALIRKYTDPQELEVSIKFSYEVGEELYRTGIKCKNTKQCIAEAREEIGGFSPDEFEFTVPTYDTSWDMLMPVILKLCYKVPNAQSELLPHIYASVSQDHVLSAFQAVVEFIKKHKLTEQ